MNGLDLFSGIGGISIALEPWVTTVAYCEQDRYAQAVLLSRMSEGKLDKAPIWDDVKTLKGSMLPKVDIIFGGFPCQDISVAGLGKGLGGERSGLFFEIVRLTNEIKPAFVFLENVPAIRTRGLREVVGTFADLRYDCRWTRLSASSVGAPHQRERWFMLAANTERLKLWDESRRWSGSSGYGQAITRNDGAKGSLADANGLRQSSKQNAKRLSFDRTGDGGQDVANTESERSGSRARGPKKSGRQINTFGNDWWAIEPNVGRVAHGVPSRMDRIKCLGNAVVPAQARQAFKRLAGLDT